MDGQKAELPYSPEAETGNEKDEYPDLVPAEELNDGQTVSLSADNGLPYPESRGVFRMKIE